MSIHEATIPGLGCTVHFKDRESMRRGHPTRRYRLYNGRTFLALPAAALPIDWTKNNTLDFPMDDNDTLGDCMVAAALHADNTFTGNTTQESVFDDKTTKTWYEQLSGGDNGLDEGTLVEGWKAGLCGNPDACILDALDVDPTNAPLVQSALQFFGGVLFMLAVPDAWINQFKTGAVWDAGAGVTANPNNGHGIWWNGCETNGNYKLQTWGTYGFITPAGVAICQPSAFVVFSLRWFNTQGVAPNGMTYDQLAALWVQAGGKQLPPSPSPTPTPTPGPTPGPTPTPTPTPNLQQQVDAVFAALEKKFARNRKVLQALQIAQGYVDGYIEQNNLAHFHAVPVQILQIVDAAFKQAETAYPQYAPILVVVQTLVDHYLPTA